LREGSRIGMWGKMREEGGEVVGKTKYDQYHTQKSFFIPFSIF
jgi:hypothetical protein